jgi:hypothetical protein
MFRYQKIMVPKIRLTAELVVDLRSICVGGCLGAVAMILEQIGHCKKKAWCFLASVTGSGAEDTHCIRGE